MEHLYNALPNGLEQICGAVITLVAAIIAAFKKGKQAGRRNR